MKKTGTHTNDAKLVGTKVAHLRSHAAVKSNAPGGKTLHTGQPSNLKGGGGLATGHTATNC